MDATVYRLEQRIASAELQLQQQQQELRQQQQQQLQQLHSDENDYESRIASLQADFKLMLEECSSLDERLDQLEGKVDSLLRNVDEQDELVRQRLEALEATATKTKKRVSAKALGNDASAGLSVVASAVDPDFSSELADAQPAVELDDGACGVELTVASEPEDEAVDANANSTTKPKGARSKKGRKATAARHNVEEKQGFFF